MATSSTIHFCRTSPCPVCQTTVSAPPSPKSFAAFIETYPCKGSYHDYAVGERFAICNRCDAVIALDQENSDG